MTTTPESKTAPNPANSIARGVQAMTDTPTKPELAPCPFCDAAHDLLEALRECADDLEAEIDERWPADLRATYPGYQKKYDRDMDTVFRARAAIARALPTPREGGE